MEKIYFLSRIHGLYWTKNGNIVDWQDTFLRRGKSTDSAMANERKTKFGENEAKKRPTFILKSYCKALNDVGLLVSHKADSENFTGILIFEGELRHALKLDSTLIPASIEVHFKGGDQFEFTVLDFFTDKTTFNVVINNNQDPLKIINFKKKLLELRS